MILHTQLKSGHWKHAGLHVVQVCNTQWATVVYIPAIIICVYIVHVNVLYMTINVDKVLFSSSGCPLVQGLSSLNLAEDPQNSPHD